MNSTYEKLLKALENGKISFPEFERLAKKVSLSPEETRCIDLERW